MNEPAMERAMREFVPIGIVASATASEVITTPPLSADELELLALWGLTFGAWFKIGLLVALVLLIMERASIIYRNVKEANSVTNYQADVKESSD